MAYNDRGEEILDNTPVEVGLEFRRPPSIEELIAMYVRSEMRVRDVMAQGSEDEDDLEVEAYEGDDILTPYELHAMAREADEEFRRAKESKERVDNLVKMKENKGAVNKDRYKGDENGRRGTGSMEGVARGDEEDSGVEGVGRAGSENETVEESVKGVAGRGSKAAK